MGAPGPRHPVHFCFATIDFPTNAEIINPTISNDPMASATLSAEIIDEFEASPGCEVDVAMHAL